MGSTVVFRKDYLVGCAKYREDEGFYPKGTTGTILGLCDIGCLPGITPEMHERLVAREVFAKDRVHFLVQLGWKVASIPVGILKMDCEDE